jgi:hypothetical protein
MITAKKFFTLAVVVILITTSSVLAQNVTVSKQAERVKGNSTEGYAVELNGTLDEVTTAFTKYLKTFSKTKIVSNVTQVNEAQFSATKYLSPFYAITRNASDKALAWIGLNPAEWPSEDEAKKGMGELEKVMYNFGVKFYRDKIQGDVDEALLAQQTAEKQQQKLLYDNKTLNTKLENNQKEKIRLEKALIDNKAENENLILGIDRNKKAQDSVAVALDQIRKMVEFHKERQKKVN